MSETTLFGWHWMPADKKLRFAPFTTVEPGMTLEAAGPLVLCENGLHACPGAIDSLPYVYGPVLSRVALGGEVLGPDADGKVCARTRTHLWMVEPARATRALDELFDWLTERILTRADAEAEAERRFLALAPAGEAS